MLNGGYILLDLTKYVLENEVTDAVDIGDAVELTKDEFDNLKKVFDTSLNTGKPIVAKTGKLYDSTFQKGIMFVGNVYNDDDVIAFGYDDFVDAKRLYIAIFKYDSKYYIAVVDSLWMA